MFPAIPLRKMLLVIFSDENILQLLGLMQLMVVSPKRLMEPVQLEIVPPQWKVEAIQLRIVHSVMAVLQSFRRAAYLMKEAMLVGPQ
jgi:hypothetical protein